MEYVGNLYGRIGKKYFPIGKTAEEVDAELDKSKNKLLDILFEVQQFHGIEAVNMALHQMLIEHKKTMKFPHPVSANNGDDIVYIHEDGTQTWNTEKKDN